ncbi:MAG: nodulation protein NfeD [Desulfoplanes sp.]|nr:nodulation protein NfeD [Desulfoplanes sp.]MDD4648567.1 nodulation protein NfeD [Desulfoplanes sp.]
MRQVRCILVMITMVYLPFLVSPCTGTAAETDANIACLYLEIEASISPAQEELLTKCLRQGTETGAQLLLIRLDTPGGLGSSMRTMVTTMLNTPLPIAIWVGPAGARAASAGVFLVAASTFAAMAPQTSIGAASPVGMSGKDISETMAKKIQNDILSLLRGVVIARDRNLEWYKKAVTESASITAEDAVQKLVVEFLSPSKEDFLDQIGIRGLMVQGKIHHFSSAQVQITPYEPDFKYKLLAWLLNPSIAYFLFLGGIAGLFFELSNPGAIFPGVFGALCLLLGMYALSILPTTPAGILLILLGLILLVIELKVVSYGLLTVAGIASLVCGSLILFDFEYGFTALPLRIILGTAAGVCVLFLAVLFLVAKAQTRPRAMGLEALINQTGEILSWQKQRGTIKVRGERWNARTQDTVNFHPGDKIRVARADGLILDIEEQAANTKKRII